MPDSPAPLILPAQRPARAQTIIVTPEQFAVADNERIRIVSYNSLSGCVLAVQGRFVKPDGTIAWLQATHQPNTDRSAKTQEYALPGVRMTNLVVFANTGAPLVGQTFVKVQLIIGTGATAIVLGTLLQGYVTANGELSWPGSPVQSSTDGSGYLREINGTDPAAGNTIAETCPANAQWELVWLNAKLVTDATVTNRTPYLYLADPVAGSGNIVTMTVSFPASTTVFFGFLQGLANSSSYVGSFAAHGLTLGLTLLALQVLNVKAQNFQAGDDFSEVIYAVREHIVP